MRQNEPVDLSPRRGRPPKGQARLSREAIVDAALALIDDDGVDSLSMRSVARRLSSDPKSLYNHVGGIDDLLDAVAERLLGSITAPALTGDLRTDLRAIADAFRTGTLHHRAAAPLILTRQLTSIASLAPVNTALTAMHDAGFPADDAVHLMRATLAALIGTLLREVNAVPAFGTTDTDAITQRESDLAASELSAVADVAPQLARFDADAEYRFTVDFLIDGVIARLPAADT